jgi:hypothetical protein
MYLFNQRLAAEWQDLDIAYPEWLTRIVLDELYYILTLVAVCTVCFAVGMIMGFIAVTV